ncbi:3D domain-containing protein, partial [Priestia megaterium]
AQQQQQQQQQAAQQQQQQSQQQASGKSMTVEATAYTANCAGCSGTTATGVNLKSNPNQRVIAVDPSVIPLGSKVYVEGYGQAVAADTGGAIKGNRIDVFVSSDSAAQDWGRRSVKITVID